MHALCTIYIVITFTKHWDSLARCRHAPKSRYQMASSMAEDPFFMLGRHSICSVGVFLQWYGFFRRIFFFGIYELSYILSRSELCYSTPPLALFLRIDFLSSQTYDFRFGSSLIILQYMIRDTITTSLYAPALIFPPGLQERIRAAITYVVSISASQAILLSSHRFFATYLRI